MRLCLPFLIALSCLPPPAAAAERYMGAILYTQHVGDDTLNNINPGLTYGRRWPGRDPDLEYHLEAGVTYNSYEEISPVLLAGFSQRLAQIGPGQLRIGASLGTAYYEAISDQLEQRYNIPTLGGFIPIVAATVSYRIGDTEIRITALPPDIGVDAVLNLSVAYRF